MSDGIRVFVDGVEINAKYILGLEALEEKLSYQEVLNFYLVEVIGNLKFTGELYETLYNNFKTNPCGESEIEILDKQEIIFTGVIIYNEIQWDIVRCIADCEITDNNYFNLIDNNKSIKAYLDVARSKNDKLNGVAAISLQTNITLKDETNVTSYTGRNGIRLYDAFKMLVEFMSDGEVEFASDYFDPSGTGTDLAKYSVLITGVSIRDGSGIYPTMNFEDLFDDVNRLFNIAASIEKSGETVTLRIEDKAYFRGAPSTTVITAPKEIIQNINSEDFYAKVTFGSRDVSDDLTYYPDIPFTGFQQEEYHLLGQCNTGNELDLRLKTLITDTNIIQDVLPSGTSNDSYDDDIFLVQLDSGNNAVMTLDPTATQYYYNVGLSNYEVSQRWFNGIPNSIASWLVDASTEGFRASNLSDLSLTPAASVDIVFSDDSTSPNYDTGGNYDTATGRYTAAQAGSFTFHLRISALWYLAYGNLRFLRYDSSNVLQEDITLLNTVSIYPFYSQDDDYYHTFNMQVGDYVVCNYEWLNHTLLVSSVDIYASTYFETISTIDSDIIVEYDVSDVPLLLTNIEKVVNFVDWKAIKSEPYKLYSIDNPYKLIKGYINEVSRNILKGDTKMTVKSGIE